MADKNLKEHIISFRIPKDQADLVQKMLEDRPIIGVKSVSQWFRKVGRDFMAGRMTYKNPQDLLVDTDI
jgi:hypothetical protein